MQVEDHKEQVFFCSNCRKPLVSVIVTRYDEDIVTEAIAKCCYCGDSSFKQKIVGLFSVGGTQSTVLGDINYDNDYVTFISVKRE